MTESESASQYSRWHVPPKDGFTVDDLLTMPGLPPHIQLIDGTLVLARPQSTYHSVGVDLLVSGLRADRPDEYKVSRQMTVILDEHNGLEPDVIVTWADALSGRAQVSFLAKDVLLAVEVVSPDSESRDRTTKPQKYAAAGIPNFWRVEATNGKPVVHVYELDPLTRSYVHMGMHRDQIKVDKPYLIGIDLTAVDQL
ncbi:Uma2 family endonuclease [Streptomyces sp. DSM 110735]|uniref:Uma2 family endonuclease n=1 Tax=Streptomyces sp. DSM 110735 TaxID=2775031 RepID=UPI0018F703F2|nr:Uma2 family endonuclease [Streptomyces sp. DSM 110735]MBJ7904898.1 Uma2 family endonuclease [Streptomyces sp. DSM 110735]